jgi:hypothetical protein
MCEKFQPFVINAIKEITDNLSDTSVTPFAPRQNATFGSARDLRQFILDSSSAESVNNGSIIFPDPGFAVEPHWCIFVSASPCIEGSERTFLFKGRLLADSGAQEFVQEAYENILMRPVDVDGLAIYPQLIENHQHTRREVIRILADSEEARSHPHKVLAIPDPSSWLEGIQKSDDPKMPFPSLVVRASSQGTA